HAKASREVEHLGQWSRTGSHCFAVPVSGWPAEPFRRSPGKGPPGSDGHGSVAGVCSRPLVASPAAQSKFTHAERRSALQAKRDRDQCALSFENGSKKWEWQAWMIGVCLLSNSCGAAARVK